ncbi:hypothetical protein VTK73DRAFT_1957 [Phialemonium thermophilum]|uniref:Tr-type G domain-containing protein n=1 Tax=Phialemonium thermophilum TaxID=223376 RepID=A0ABR3X6S1_9PEZI
MSRHQAFRNVQSTLEEHYYDSDDAYSEEEEGLSPEDEALMQQGTADVRAALGVEASKVTTEQIQEALWHYYYDVDKTVTYLMTKFISPPPKAAGKSTQKAKTPGHEFQYTSSCVSTTTLSLQASISTLFRGVQWGHVPEDRRGILIEPVRPRGGLLGGSGAPPKLSKLQQLAAARKKKVDEKKAAEEKTENTRQKLGELSVEEVATSKRESVPSSGIFGKRQKLSDSGVAGRMPLARAPASDERVTQDAQEDASRAGEDTVGRPAGVVKAEAAVERAPERAEPSAFARTLFGSSRVLRRPQQQEFFTLPYMTHPSLADAFSEPSPDDVVLAAQAKAGKKTSAAAPAKKKGAVDSVAGDVKTLKIDDTPLPRSKNLDVISEFEKSKSKKTASFVVVGHVDAGKSTMMGRLLLDLNVVDQRTIDKFRKEAEKIGKSSFALAWVLDQRTEERARGVTIDIATNRFETDKTVFTILDAPGHRDFIPNMIAGASQADFAILVIDAGVGEFESGLKGQTREHSLLIRSMGVSRIIVAVNKLDTVNWSKERFDEITDQVSGFLTATGFQAKNISFVPVSGLNGDNLVRRSENPAASWYQGPTILEELENSEPTARALAKPLRMTVSEVFRTMQSPVTVSGRIDAGSLQTGDALLVQPSGEKAYVKSLQLDEQPVDWAVAGQNVVIHLSNIDPIHVRVGDIICDPARPVPCLDTFTLKALAFDFLMPMQVDVHRGRLHSAGRIEEIKALLDKVTGAVTKKKPKIVKPANVARIVVKLGSKVPLEAGQRVVLRSGGETVAAGLLE